VSALTRAKHKRQFSNAKEYKKLGIIVLIGHIGVPLRPIPCFVIPSRARNLRN
jgi:hypothetical protein